MPLSLTATWTLPPLANVACPAVFNATVALTLPPEIAAVLNSPATAPVIATVGAEVTGVYSIALALELAETVFAASVSVADTVIV